MSLSGPAKEPAPLDRLLTAHGGYRKLRSFQIAELVYDGTVVFCGRFIEKRSRTNDQMVQAARSGRQNIAEGSIASATSKKTELKLTNVAKASLEELLLDYQDFLRQRGLPLWGKDSPAALAVRGRYRADTPTTADPYGFATATAEVAANTLICMINQATYLLKRQLEKLDRDFLEHGGFTERLYQKRTEFKRQTDRSDVSDRSDKSDGSDVSQKPGCPRCGKPMVLRTARKGPRAGQRFWGCSGYPECTGTRPAAGASDQSDQSDQSDKSDLSDRHSAGTPRPMAGATDRSDRSDKSDPSDQPHPGPPRPNPGTPRP